jgi:hypothetical protein
MEKIILLAIWIWFSAGVTDGFQPPKPVRMPFNPKTEVSKPQAIPIIGKWKSDICKPMSTN